MNSASIQRDFGYDDLKALLMTLVVVYHFIFNGVTGLFVDLCRLDFDSLRNRIHLKN
jgi:hypothetical protein